MSGKDTDKALILTNIEIMKLSLLNSKPWIIIMEDDSIITKNFKNKVYRSIHKYHKTKAFSFDKVLGRTGIDMLYSFYISKEWHGTGTNMYHKSILPLLIKELDYITRTHTKKQGYYTFDYYLYWLLNILNIPFRAIPLNIHDSDTFKSQLDHGSTGRIPFSNKR